MTEIANTVNQFRIKQIDYNEHCIWNNTKEYREYNDVDSLLRINYGYTDGSFSVIFNDGKLCGYDCPEQNHLQVVIENNQIVIGTELLDNSISIEQTYVYDAKGDLIECRIDNRLMGYIRTYCLAKNDMGLDVSCVVSTYMADQEETFSYSVDFIYEYGINGLPTKQFTIKNGETKLSAEIHWYV